jgi:hypothetical protein
VKKRNISIDLTEPRSLERRNNQNRTGRGRERITIERTNMDYEGFIHETEPSLPDNNDCRGLERSKVFLVSRREGYYAWESVLYIRKHLVDLEKKIMKEFWNNPNKSTLYVQGSPGCGKTCFFYLWARLLCSCHENKRVLIIQFREIESCFIWIREANGVLWRRNEQIKPSKLEDEVDTILDKNAATPFDLCIHDGVVAGTDFCKRMLGQLNAAVGNKIKKVVHVTSLAFSLSTGGQFLAASGPILQLSVDSWRLQDYIEAIKCKEFAERLASMLRGEKKALLENNRDDDGSTKQNSITDDASDKIETVSNTDKETSNEAVIEDEMVDDRVSGYDGDTTDDVTAALTDVIETKYYYAGGSARFMFDFRFSELITELEGRWENVAKDDWKHFASATVASATPVAVNTLMQQFGGKASPVSKFILFRAYEKCKTELVDAVKAAAENSNNPALKGWAFELEQIDLIRLSLESSPERPEYITNKKGLTFRPHSAIDFDEKKLLSNGDVKADGTIIWCQKWNQGCFDVAFYKETTLYTLQFTVSKEHSLKPKYIRMLRDALLKKGAVVEAAVHVGVGKAEGFQFKVETSGTGRQGNAKEPPEFTINAYHSPPLEKANAPTVVFQAELSHVLEKVDMWELSTTKKRRKG